MAGPETGLTWAGEPLNADADQATRTEGQVRRDDGLQLLHPRVGWRHLGHPRGGRGAKGGARQVNGPEDVPDWDAINWQVHEGNVRRLRQRIFKAAREQDWAKVRSLQKMMLRSWSNTLVSVRQVTQRNAGRRTAGIDGQVALSSRARAEMAVRVHQTISTWEPAAGPARVCTEGQWKTPPARHSRARGPLPPGTGPARAGTGVGGPVRAQIVRVPAGPWLRRCDRRAVHHAERQEQAGVDRGRRLVGGVRQDRSSAASRRARVVPRQGHDRGLAEGRGDRGRVRSRRPGRELHKAA